MIGFQQLDVTQDNVVLRDPGRVLLDCGHLVGQLYTYVPQDEMLVIVIVRPAHHVADIAGGEHLVVDGVVPAVLIFQHVGANVGNQVKGNVH